MTHTRITPENAASFIGAHVRFNYGCMHGSEEAWVVGAEATRWGNDPWKDLPVASFANAGTNVPTTMLRIVKGN